MALTATVVMSTLIHTYMLDKSNLQLLVGVEAHVINAFNAQNILIYANATGFESKFVTSFVCAFFLHFFCIFIPFNVFGRSFSWFISSSSHHLFLPTLLSPFFVRSLVGHLLFLVCCVIGFCLRLCLFSFRWVLFPFLGAFPKLQKATISLTF